MLTKTQIKVILILLDNKGHAGWELAECLDMEYSNLCPLLKKLVRNGVIRREHARKSQKKQKKEGDYREVPYQLADDLDGLKTMIGEVAKSDKLFDVGFILEIIENSKYIKSLREIYGEELNECVEKEIRENYPPYTNPFFVKLIEPQLVEKAYCYCTSDESIDRNSDMWKEECRELVDAYK